MKIEIWEERKRKRANERENIPQMVLGPSFDIGRDQTRKGICDEDRI